MLKIDILDPNIHLNEFEKSSTSENRFLLYLNFAGEKRIENLLKEMKIMSVLVSGNLFGNRGKLNLCHKLAGYADLDCFSKTGAKMHTMLLHPSNLGD